MAVSDEQWVAMRHAALRAARKIVKDEQQAEDCAHEALAELLAKPDALRTARSVEALASTVAKRRALDAVRQHDAVRRSILRLGSLVPPDVPDLSDGVVDRVTAGAVTNALESLPPTTRAVLLRLAHGDTVHEAAAHLGISKRAAENHLQRGRKRLRSVLAPMLSLAAFAALAAKSLRHTVKPAGIVAVPVAAAVAVVLVAPHSLPQPSGRPERDRPAVVAEQAPEPLGVTTTLPVTARPVDLPSATDKLGVVVVLRSRSTERGPRQALVKVSVGNQTIIIEPTQGRSDRGPVENALACAQDLTITPYVIGCP